MSVQRYAINGYGQLELNQVQFPTTGAIEAQCDLSYYDATAGVGFKVNSTDANGTICEVGMLLAVDKANNKAKLPVAAETLPIALNYTSEWIYDDFKKGLKQFAMTEDIAGGHFLPRLGYLSVGEKFTTNCLAYDTSEFADDDAVDTAIEAYATTPVYGGISTIGAIKLSGTAPSVGPVLKVVKDYTMPDGISHGVMFQVIKA